MTTRIEVSRHAGHAVVRLRTGHLAPRRLPDVDGRVRVALVATGALLLGGDDVRVEVAVGPGIDLEIVEVAGLVAYDMRDAAVGAATWGVDVHVGAQASLVWAGLPFVVADGATVARSTRVDLARGARAVLRETVVLGRTGETGGHLETQLHAYLEGEAILAESLVLDAASRSDPALLGQRRCLDVVTALGLRLTEPAALQLEGMGSVHRELLRDAHEAVAPRVLTNVTSVIWHGNTRYIASALASVP